MTQTATTARITFGTPVIVGGAHGTVTKLRNFGTECGVSFGGRRDGVSFVTWFAASELTIDDQAVAKAADTAARYARQEAILRDEVEALNALLGLADADHSRKVTFGYIGNGKLTSTGWDLSDCLWSVFLPHPGRVGKAEDRVGEFKTGDLEGIVATRRALAALTQGVRLAQQVQADQANQEAAARIAERFRQRRQANA